MFHRRAPSSFFAALATAALAAGCAAPNGVLSGGGGGGGAASTTSSGTGASTASTGTGAGGAGGAPTSSGSGGTGGATTSSSSSTSSSSGSGGGGTTSSSSSSGSGGGAVALLINEVVYDTPSVDAGCFIEIIGPAGMSLAGYTLQGVNGSGGATYATIDLGAHAIGNSGYFVVAQDATVVVAPGAASMVDPLADLQNGPDSVLLLHGATVVDALGYGTFGAADTFAGEGTASAGAKSTLQSLSRLPNGSDTGDNATDFKLATQTPGAPNL